MVDLEKFKFHARIDDDFEDSYIQLILDAAINYVSKITGVPNDANAPPEYDLAIMILSLHWYTNREVLSDRGTNQVPYGLGMLIANLRTNWTI